jgi:AraC-like DNA-binding protein
MSSVIRVSGAVPEIDAGRMRMQSHSRRISYLIVPRFMDPDKSDILSEVFSVLRLTSSLYFRAELGSGAAVLVPRERRHIRFHLALAGQCTLVVGEGMGVTLAQGEIALVPDGAAQVIAADPQAIACPLGDLIAAGALRDGVLAGGAPPARAVLLCGFLEFDEAVPHPLLASLPGLIHLRAVDLGAEPWVAAALRLLELEANYAASGSRAILARLVEIILIQATRRLAAHEGHGFLGALADPRLSAALKAMHADPARAWRVGDLAALSAMSRTRFAARFTEAVGQTPMDYLTGWRLMKARGLLASSALGMADIAERCGYASVPSFSRRFKERFGIGPGGFRRVRVAA